MLYHNSTLGKRNHSSQKSLEEKNDHKIHARCVYVCILMESEFKTDYKNQTCK